MKLTIYQIDTFTNQVFGGNPAAVCPLPDGWLPTATMQQIANENNLSETAFYTNQANQYQIRWFTPTTEVDLCGHATIASAYVLFHCEQYQPESVTFQAKSSLLTVKRDRNNLVMNFPSDQLAPVPITEALLAGFSIRPTEAYKGRSDYLFIFQSEAEIITIKIDLTKIGQLPVRGVIISAPGEQTDFVSRFFAPQSGVAEDPVTGSAHTTLTPYWSQRLGKTTLTARQLSRRPGFLTCQFLGDRTEIAGQAVLYLRGEIYL
jgi:predicted PhzF superfamily epimerase YddE/YHI9